MTKSTSCSDAGKDCKWSATTDSRGIIEKNDTAYKIRPQRDTINPSNTCKFQTIDKRDLAH